MEESGQSPYTSLCKFSFKSGEFEFLAEVIRPHGFTEGVAICYGGSGLPKPSDIDAICDWCDDSAQIVCDRYDLDLDEITKSFDLAIEQYILNKRED